MEDKRCTVMHENDEFGYYYCVNTFYDGEPVQVCGYVMAENEEDAIRKVIIRETIEERCGYEFLELKRLCDMGKEVVE